MISNILNKIRYFFTNIDKEINLLGILIYMNMTRCFNIKLICVYKL